MGNQGDLIDCHIMGVKVLSIITTIRKYNNY